MKIYEKYGRNPSWMVKQFEKYRRKLLNDMETIWRKLSWNVKWNGKYWRKLWNDIENMEERQCE